MTQPLRSSSAPERAPRAALTAVPPRGPGAIVIGADYRGLGVVRSLGRRGMPVVVLTHGDDVLAAKSRYADRRLALEGQTDEEQSMFLLGLADANGLEGWTLFPTEDETAAMVARRHDLLATRFTLTTPPWDVLRWADDKRLTYRLAESLGVPYPRTWSATTPAEAAAGADFFPTIVKPAVKDGFNRLIAAKAWRTDNRHELFERFAEAAQLFDPGLILLQEVIPGGGEAQFAYAALCDQGRALASVVARRTRQYPADFGRASTYVETIEQPEISALSQRLLEEIRFTGLVEVEFKRDPRDGLLKLLDINPRVWGWHSLCQRAGVDFPFLACRLARSEPVPESRATPGVRWLRLSTDLPTALREILRGRLSARTYLRSLRGPRESAIFARDDPWPACFEFPMLAGVLLRRLLRGDGV